MGASRRALGVGTVLGFLAAGALVGGAAAVVSRSDSDTPSARELSDAIVAQGPGDAVAEVIGDGDVSAAEYAAAVQREVQCLDAAGAVVVGPFPSVDGTQLVYEYTSADALDAGRASGEEIDRSYDDVAEAGHDCHVEFAQDITRVWMSQVDGDRRQALLDARAETARCLGVDGNESDGEMLESARASEGACDDVTFDALVG